MNTPLPRSIYDFEFHELVELLGSESSASLLFHSLYVARRLDGEIPADIPGVTRDGLRLISSQQGSMSTKYLFGLGHTDTTAIESVRIKRRTGVTACVSTQAGCAMRCVFCASGANGLVRNLSAGEIVEQVIALGPEVNRVVYMGVGEPLMNLDNTLRSMRILRDRRGLALPTAGMTLSTCGDPSGLRRLREVHMRYNLTVSLHATRDETRHQLMPGTARHRVGDVVHAAESWSLRHKRPVTYAYMVLPGMNDTHTDIQRLGKWFANGTARLNLMRWNPVFKNSAIPVAKDRDLHRMLATLRSLGVDASVRDTQGLDVEAACGQLRLHRTTHRRE